MEVDANVEDKVYRNTAANVTDLVYTAVDLVVEVEAVAVEQTETRVEQAGIQVVGHHLLILDDVIYDADGEAVKGVIENELVVGELDDEDDLVGKPALVELEVVLAYLGNYFLGLFDHVGQNGVSVAVDEVDVIVFEVRARLGLVVVVEVEVALMQELNGNVVRVLLSDYEDHYKMVEYAVEVVRK